MLTSIRTASQTWLGKIVLSVIFVFLIAGIAIFGVEEFFRGSASTKVATVGDTPISAEAVRESYQRQLQRYQQQLKRPLTPDQARALGLERQVLSQLITEAALDEKTRSLGLAVSDDAVRRAIREEKSFQGQDGKFDLSLYYQTLQRAGLNEANFVREQRAVTARLQLADAITANLPVPRVMREAVHRYSTERRAIGLISLPPAAAGEVPAPSEEELTRYYDDNKASYRAPEARALALLVLDPEGLAKPDAVTDEDLRKTYEAGKLRFGNPERRTIQQITFPDEAAAQEARKVIEGGEKPFEAVAVERGVDAKNLALGTLSKAELFDKAVAEAAFALQKDAVSQPVKGRFGTVLLRVTTIEPETIKPFDEVKDDIRKELALEAARKAVDPAHSAIEEARDSEKPLAEIARDRGLNLVEIPAVDSSGNDPSGKAVEGIPEKSETLAAAFRADVGSNYSEPLRTKNGGFVWYEVTRVDPARDKPLAEVKAEVEQGWRQAETAKRLTAKAKEIADKLDKGEAIEALAQEAGGTAKTVSDIARSQAKDDLPTDVIERVFATPVGKAGSAPSGDGRAVFKVTEAVMPGFVPGDASDQTMEKSFRTALSDDVLGEYIAVIQKEAGVEINQAAFRRALGGEN